MSAVFMGASVWASGTKDIESTWVEVREVAVSRVQLDRIYPGPANMSVDEARALARALYRLARRVEKRLQSKEES